MQKTKARAQVNNASAREFAQSGLLLRRVIASRYHYCTIAALQNLDTIPQCRGVPLTREARWRLSSSARTLRMRALAELITMVRESRSRAQR